MRLLNTTTGRLHWVEDPRKVRYVVLSHVWSKDPREEMTYQEVQNFSPKPEDPNPILHPSFSQKVRSFCKAAKDLGFVFGWADSCCIDKTSSSELSEAITSMYDWYRYADMCLAYLSDVDIPPDVLADVKKRNQALCDSQWFRRGWTLQELLAPSILLFFSKNWVMIGSKEGSATHIARVTKIDRDVLTFKRSLDEVSVACRMSWAASRTTAREEDEAYCLMGIFGVNIPTIYGEGRYAFVRLQEEIIRTIPDQSIFAWGRILSPNPFQFGTPNNTAITTLPDLRLTDHLSGSNTSEFLLAASPKDFLNSSHIVHLPHDKFVQKYALSPTFAYQVFTVTAYGIHAQLPLIAVVGPMDKYGLLPTHLAFLACETQDNKSLVALLLRPQARSTGFSIGVAVVERQIVSRVLKAGFDSESVFENRYYRAVYLPIPDFTNGLQREFLTMAGLYLPHRPSRKMSDMKRDHRVSRSLRSFQDNFMVQLSQWSRAVLALDGFQLRLTGEDDQLRRAAQDDDARIVPQSRVLHLDLTPWFEIEYKEPGGLDIQQPIKIYGQIGRCECLLGRSSGIALLGALVWSRDARSSLEEPFKEAYHPPNHPVHLHSWAYRDGVASTNIDLQLLSAPQKGITVRLTLYHQPDRSDADQPNANVFELGVEVTSFEVSSVELPEVLPALNFNSVSTQGGLLSPPLTAANSRSSADPAPNEDFLGSISTGPTLALHDSEPPPTPASQIPRRHSISGISLSDHPTHTRAEFLSIVEGRIASNQRRSRPPSTASRGDVETDPMYLGDFPIHVRPSRLDSYGGDILDGRVDNIQSLPLIAVSSWGHQTPSAEGGSEASVIRSGQEREYSLDTQFHPRGALNMGNGVTLKPEMIQGQQDQPSLPSGFASAPRTSSAQDSSQPRSPRSDMDGQGPPPRGHRNGGEDIQSSSDKVPPQAPAGPPAEGREIVPQPQPISTTGGALRADGPPVDPLLALSPPSNLDPTGIVSAGKRDQPGKDGTHRSRGTGNRRKSRLVATIKNIFSRTPSL